MAQSEYEAGLDAIKRRRAIAQAMQSQAFSPLQAQISGTGNYPIQTKISPLQILAQLGTAYVAKKQNEKADKEYGDIAKAMASDKSKALDALMVPQDMAPATSSDEGPTHAPMQSRRARPQAIQAAIDAGIDPSVISAASPKQFSGTLSQGQSAYVDGQQVASSAPKPDFEAQKLARQAAADAETARHNKASETNVAAGVSARANAGNALSPEGMDLAAQEYLASGKLPPGLGRAAAGINAKIVSRAADIAAANGDDAKAATLHRAAFGAAKGALNKLTQQRTMVGSFERTALKNLEIALEESKKVDRTGSPVINRWLLAGKKNLAGDVAVGRFHTALTSALNEYAKVLSGATGAAGISDAARKEAESLLSTADTPEAVAGIADIMKREMANREAGFAEQEAQLHETMGGKSSVDVAPAAEGAPQAPGAPMALPPKNAKGWVLHQDAQGNKAYVGPNNEVEEVH